MNSATDTHPVQHTKIRPSSGWNTINVKQIWLFRDLFLTLAVRDIKLRYRQTALGAIWVVIQPLLAAGIFSFIFGAVAKLPSEHVPYFLLVFAGQLGWGVFSSTLSKASGSMVGNMGLVSKVFFPRLILPLSGILSSMVDFGVALVMLAVLMALNGITPGIQLLLLPFWVILLLMLAVGIGFITSTLNVRYRDVGHVLPVIVSMLLYASPVAYSLQVALDRVNEINPLLRLFFFLNPLSGLLEGLRWSLLNTPPPEISYVLYSVVCCTVTFVFGAFFFSRFERDFVDVI